MALIIGIALDKAHIGSIEDKVLDYFFDYNVKRSEKNIRCDYQAPSDYESSI